MTTRMLIAIGTGAAALAVASAVLEITGSCADAKRALAAASDALGPAAAVYEQLDNIDDEIAGQWQAKAVQDYHARLRAYQAAQDAARGCE